MMRSFIKRFVIRDYERPRQMASASENFVAKPQGVLVVNQMPLLMEHQVLNLTQSSLKFSRNFKPVSQSPAEKALNAIKKKLQL